MVVHFLLTAMSLPHECNGGGAGVPRRSTTTSSMEETVAWTPSRLLCLTSSSSTWMIGTLTAAGLLNPIQRSWLVLVTLSCQRFQQTVFQYGTCMWCAPRREMLSW